MSISYKKISKCPTIFKRLFGMKVKEFDLIVEKVEIEWEKSVTSSYKRPGRNYKLGFKEMVMMLLLYYRTYTSQMQIGFMFGIDEANVCRIIKKLEPILAKIVAISKNRELKKEDVDILIDVTEQKIERPEKNQKEYYSGKKKCHTLKTEVRIDKNGRITNVSKAFLGKTHDFKIHKQSDPLPMNTRVLADSGYQGLKKLRKDSKTPIKKKKKKPLTETQKLYNKMISKIRVKIENTFAQIKNFRILSDRYRNKRKGHNLKFNIIAGITNIKNGFMSKALAAA